MHDILVSRAFLNSLYERPPPTDIAQLFDEVRDMYCLTHIVYHATNVKGLTENGPYLKLTYPGSWIERYYQKNYFKIDPVVEAGIKNFLPFNWADLDWSNKARREFLGDSAHHKIGLSGMSVPIRGVGGEHAILSVTSNTSEKEWAQFLRDYIGDFQVVANFIHQSIIEIEGVDRMKDLPSLSIRERDALQYCANGLNNDQIAEKLGVTERTVRAFMETARHKLGAVNRTHAVTKALSLGLILPPD